MRKVNLIFVIYPVRYSKIISLGIALCAMFFLTPLLGGVGGGFLTGGAGVGFAQNIGINSIGVNPDASSVLDVAADGATKGGLLIPRVSLISTTDVTTIASPANSLMVYNTNAAMLNGNGAGFYYYSTAAVKWIYVDAASNGPGTAGQVLASQESGNQPQWSALSTSGGGPTGCASCITSISTTEWSVVTWAQCRENCRSLTQGGFSDWRMPTWDEAAYYGSGAFDPPDGTWISGYVWTSTPWDSRVASSPLNGNWVVFTESTGNWFHSNYTSINYGRCVR